MKLTPKVIPTLLFLTFRILHAQASVVTGYDEANFAIENVSIENYKNHSYTLKKVGNKVHVKVDLTKPIPTIPFEGKLYKGNNSLKKIASVVTLSAQTREEAVGKVIDWIRRNIIYQYPKSPLSPYEVLNKRRGYCTGIAKLAKEMIQSLGIPVREIPGIIFVKGKKEGIFHRWIEVDYNGTWIFSDPYSFINFVPATYVKIASTLVPYTTDPTPGYILERNSRIIEISKLQHFHPKLTIKTDKIKGARTSIIRK